MSKQEKKKTYPQHCNCCGYDWDSIKEHPKCCARCKRYDYRKEQK